jgi:hypothetical protein
MKTAPGLFRLADYADSPDHDTDPDPFKREEITARRCAGCGRDWTYYNAQELERWFSRHMPADEAKAMIARIKHDLD